jgi:hypothetical protein
MLADETKGLKAILAEDDEIQISEVQECFNYFGYHISRQEILSPVGRIENKLEESDDEDEELVVASVLNSLKTLPVGDIGLLMKKEEIVTLRHYCEKQIQDG